MTTRKWLSRHTRSLVGKKVALTGSTGGLGRALTAILAELGAELILLDRNQKKAEALENELKSACPTCKITRITVDMEDFDSVKAATDSLLALSPDYLILNAGAYAIKRRKTSIGYDNVFTINAISPYYMARKLEKTVAEQNGKIVAVGSIAHNYSKSDETDVDFTSRKKASHIYGNAKRYLTYGLFGANSEKNTFTVAHPGITFTNITAHYPKIIFALIKHPMKIIFHSTKKASLSIIAGLFNDTPNRSWIGPRLFNVWGIPKTRRLTTAKEDEQKYLASAMDSLYQTLK